MKTDCAHKIAAWRYAEANYGAALLHAEERGLEPEAVSQREHDAAERALEDITRTRAGEPRQILEKLEIYIYQRGEQEPSPTAPEDSPARLLRSVMADLRLLEVELETLRALHARRAA